MKTQQERNAYKLQWARNNPERIKEINSKYRLKNKKKAHDYKQKYMKEHKGEIKQKQAIYRAKTKEKARAVGYLRYYGITLKIYQEMFIQQKGLCAICKLPEKSTKKKMCVDHDHITNQVRALLCHKCNVGIGMLNDDINMLEKAIVYLKTYKGRDDSKQTNPL